MKYKWYFIGPLIVFCDHKRLLIFLWRIATVNDEMHGDAGGWQSPAAGHSVILGKNTTSHHHFIITSTTQTQTPVMI